MTARRPHDEIQELLGAYALDAVDGAEATEIEDHLRECPRCRAEVAEHRETAAHLVDAHLDPPAAVWDRVAAHLDEVPPPLDLSRYQSDRPPRRSSRWQPIAAAAAVVGLVILGAVTFQQRREVDDVEQALEHQELAVSALAAFDDPDARHATLHTDDGSMQLRAAVLPDGTGYLLANRLPDLPDGRTYQLWTMDGDQAESAGVLGSDPDIIAFDVPPAASGLAISEEREGGADRPTLPAMMSGELA